MTPVYTAGSQKYPRYSGVASVAITHSLALSRRTASATYLRLCFVKQAEMTERGGGGGATLARKDMHAHDGVVLCCPAKQKAIVMAIVHRLALAFEPDCNDQMADHAVVTMR